ncbi:TetR/AcrR family transcriptional regulator [Desulfogranum mediterraneum]|uniref:TetR/AcrR family transcriptional regulator n=1 Tax=Desulfogranum mediterraneum TaxID=160661 RepID=UPI0004015B1F|nr:TetR/AcrR family transcriptional regulator [Desulfogranum mediterraneum]
MEGEKLSRREREKRWQRQEMLAAAIELFSEKGYHNVSMNEIAKKAEFAIGTLYKFFKNKEDLYRSIIAELSGKFHQAINEVLEGRGDEIEKLRNYVKAKAAIFMDNVSIVRLYFAETRGASCNIKAGLDLEIREKHERHLQDIALIFESGMNNQRFQRIAEPYHLAVSIDSLSNAFLHLWLEAPDQHPYPEDPDVILNILFKGLLDPGES